MNMLARTTIIVIMVYLLIPSREASLAQYSSEEKEDEMATQTEIGADEEQAAKEMQKHVYGKVVGVDVPLGRLVVLGSDLNDEGQGVTYTYIVRPDTSFTVADSLSDIKVGDRVDIDYYVLNQDRIADSIAKDLQ